jgi:ABC-type uncharacterized transport system permease subunit
VPNAIYSIIALLCMVPSMAVAARREPERDSRFWLALVLGVAGPTVWAAAQIADNWNASLSATLWVGVAAGMIVFADTALINRQAWRLAPLLVPYLFIWGLFGWAFSSVPVVPVNEPAATWLGIHIAVAVLTLGLLTVAAVGALASYIQTRALKAKRRGWLSNRLPAAAESDRLSANLLIIAEIILAIGVLTGMVLERAATGRLLVADHKTMMILSAFVIIALLLLGRRLLGVPGQVVARIVLLAYLLVVLGYFGVKFVHQMPII